MLRSAAVLSLVFGGAGEGPVVELIEETFWFGMGLGLGLSLGI